MMSLEQNADQAALSAQRAPAAGAVARIVIGIPTYRRPDLLRLLLQSLVDEVKGRNLHIIIGDNECGTDAPAEAARFASTWPRIECIAVRQRGISQVRNALVRHASVVMPDWEWLIMLDDDGYVTPGWLGRLLDAAQRFDANLIGGPVDGQLPSSANIFARNSVFAARKRYATGFVPTLGGAQNLCIARKTVDLVGEPLFRNEYGASGGEDYEFFRRVKSAGGTIAWCDEAVVVEPTPEARLTVRSLLSRYATTGAYMVCIDSFYDGRATVRWQAFKGLAGCVLRALKAGLMMRRDACAREILGVAHYGGRIAGLGGARYDRYVSPKGKEKN